MRTIRTSILVLLQAGLLLSAPGQRKVTADDPTRESRIPGREASMELTDGMTVNFTMPKITRPTLFNGESGFFVRVPNGATELRLQLITSSDIDLYARWGTDVAISAAGTMIADYSTEMIANKDLHIGLSGSPGLRAGTYYVALAAFDLTAPNTGTLKVTIQNPNPTPTPVNDLTVAFGTEDNSNCPTVKKLPVTVRDAAGNLVAGLVAANFSLSEGTVAKTISVTCAGAGQCTIGYTPTDPARAADVEVKVNLNNLRTGSARKTVGLCTAPGSGGTRTVTGLKLEMGTVSGANVFTYGLQAWSTGAEPMYTLGVSLPDPAAPLLNAANRSINVAPGSYFLYGEPGAVLAAARLTVNWSDGVVEEALFNTTPVTTTTGWTRLTGSSGLSMSSTGLTNLNKVANNTGTTAGGGADFVWRLDIGGSSGGATGVLTVNVGNEDNSLCPVTKKVLVSITDSTGAAVTGLNAANFTLKENGVVRTVNVNCSSSGGGTSAGTGAVVAIVIDTSTSLSTTDLANEKSAAVNLVNSLGASDQVAVYKFGSSVDRLQAFTANKQLAIAAINSIATAGSTALYQAVFMAAQDIGAINGRRAIVLMTDGADNQGGKTIDDAINAAKTAKAPVYAVGFGTGINEAVMKRLGTETGGAFTKGATSAELQALLQTVATNITSQCEVSYSPADASKEADIAVTVTAGTRTGSGTKRVTACLGSSTSGPGWTVSPNCNYFVTPLSSAPVAAQTTGIIRVTTADACEWNAHSEVAWVKVTAVRNANGKGSGAVDYLVTANPDPVARTGRLITAAQVTTITQAGGTSCTVTISPVSARVGPGSGGGTVLVNTAAANCAWTAKSNDAWIKVSANTAGGTGPGRIAYTYDGNPTASSRSGSLTINGLTFPVTQDIGSIPGTPTVTESGIVNSASGIPPSLPGGALAQGSFFTIFASGVGPAPPRQVEQFPLPTNLGGTVVQIRQGTRTVDCYLVYTSNTQINGIIPSNAPLGDAEMIVTYNGNASRPAAVRVVRNNFGIFATSQGRGPGIIQNFQTQLEQPLNTRSVTAKPRQVIILWGTGAGPISAPDNLAPPAGNLPFPFEMTIGGKPANLLYNGRAPCCSGVDQIVAEVPADAPTGCFVPVQVKAGDVWSNVVTMAVDTNGQTCSDPGNPASTVTSTGGKIGVILLGRMSAAVSSANQGEMKIDADLGAAAFPKMPGGGDLGFNMLTSMPPAGTCQAYAGVRDISDLLGGAFGGPIQSSSGSTMLDAGAKLQVAGPGGKTATMDRAENGTYMGMLGGTLPLPGTVANLPLDAGTFTVTGTGGKDIGAFTASITLRPSVVWTNRGQLGSIDRKTPLAINWTGGAAGENLLILGYGTDQKVKASSGFLCSVPAGAGTFTVPAAAMANLPAVTSSADMAGKFGLLGILSFRTNGLASPFQAPGLDMGLLMGVQVEARSIEIK